jgi:A/G-specific adenine glycosylase
MKFSKLLIQWYLQNKRDLPWRNTSNPYRIWLSEIMLQADPCRSGNAIFFFSVDSYCLAANADEEQVLKLGKD